MADKYSLTRKRLIKEAIVLGCVIVVFALGGFFLQNYVDDLDAEQKAKEGELTALRAKVADIRKEMEETSEDIKLYNQYIKNHNPNFILDREAATQWLVGLSGPYHLDKLSITIPPLTDITKESFPIKSGALVKSDVKLSFGAITDNSVFAFIQKLQKEMPGVVVLQELKITRSGELNASTIEELSRHHITPIVSAELSFTWLGLRPEKKDKPNAK